MRPLAKTLWIAAVLAAAGSGCRKSPPAGIDTAILDRSVSPCEDFYRFACGKWLDATQIPPDKSSYSRSFTAIDERSLELLRKIAEADAAGKLDPKDRFPEKVGDFWAACMDEAGIEARSLGDLRDVWARIDRVKDLELLADAIGELHRHGTFPAFSIESQQDARDATQVIGGIEQGGLSLPDRDYYLRTAPADVAIQVAFRAHVARMLELAGEPAAQAEAEAQAIYRLERDLAASHWTKVEARDPKRTYNRVELAGLEKLAPRFDWKRYLVTLGHPGVTAFSTSTPKALEALNELLASTPLETWRAYLRWWVLDAMAGPRALPKALVDEQFAFWSRHFSGATSLEPRWKHCVRSTGEVLGEALGQGFARRYFGEEGKARSRELISAVELAMARDLEALPWMDGPTRRFAQQKLDRVVNKVGYPDAWRDYTSMRLDRTSYLRSLIAANTFEVNRQLEKIGRPVDRQEWGMAPQEVNAYYHWALNEMVFPAGILQPPFFTSGAPDAFNYGAIGMIMAHELTHGFDDEGGQFDASGNLRDWWTPEVGKEFTRRAACLVEQFDGYAAVGDLKVNGKLTLGENIADLGGIKLALAAYRNGREGKQPEPAVAGFTPDQVFFLAFAQSWCTVIRPERAALLANVDPHSPPRWRVNGPLSDLPAFQQAFSCPDTSRMVRPGKLRCELW